MAGDAAQVRGVELAGGLEQVGLGLAGGPQADLLDAAGGHGGVGEADFPCVQGLLEGWQLGQLAADADQLGGGAGGQAAGGAQPGGGAEGAAGGAALGGIEGAHGAGDDGVEDVPEPEQLLDPLALSEGRQGGRIVVGDVAEGVAEAVEGGGLECWVAHGNFCSQYTRPATPHQATLYRLLALPAGGRPGLRHALQHPGRALQEAPHGGLRHSVQQDPVGQLAGRPGRRRVARLQDQQRPLRRRPGGPGGST